jgi:hypothetical protein
MARNGLIDRLQHVSEVLVSLAAIIVAIRAREVVFFGRTAARHQGHDRPQRRRCITRTRVRLPNPVGGGGTACLVADDELGHHPRVPILRQHQGEFVINLELNIPSQG